MIDVWKNRGYVSQISVTKSKNQLTIHIMELLLERTFVTETTMASVECGLKTEDREALRYPMSKAWAMV